MPGQCYRSIQGTVQEVVQEQGSDGDHGHFLVQSVPTISQKKIIQLD